MMKRKYIDYEQKRSDAMTKAKKHCRCGHTQIVPRIKGREYVLCTWCHGRLYHDDDKQQEYDKKRQKSEFRSSFMKYMANSKC